MKMVKVVNCEKVDKIELVSRGRNETYDKLYGIKISDADKKRSGEFILEITKAQLADLISQAIKDLSD